MPVVTGTNGALEKRPGLELQGGLTPGFFLSSTVQEDPKGTPSSQLSATLDAGQLIGVEGLGVGGRWIGGGDEGGYGEPMVRYRHDLDDEERFTLQVAGFGTRAVGSARSANYEATRIGGELAINGRATPKSSWIELSGFAGASVLGLNADGSYCVSATTGFGVDCNEDGTDTRRDGSVSGAFPAIFLGIGLDFARHLDLPLHGVRLDAMAAGGLMPQVQNGERIDTLGWSTIGLSLTFRGGASEQPK